MSTEDVSRTIDALSFSTADLMQPITVSIAAGQYLLTQLGETDPLRWDVTQAVGSLQAASKSIEQAADRLLALVVHDAERADESQSLATFHHPV